MGALLSQESSGDLGPNRAVERPKVIHNSKTGNYVLWMHIDDSSYNEAKVGVATGSTVCGQYHYLGSWQPLGYQSRGMTLYQELDGTTYLMSEDVSSISLISGLFEFGYYSNSFLFQYPITSNLSRVLLSIPFCPDGCFFSD